MYGDQRSNLVLQKARINTDPHWPLDLMNKFCSLYKWWIQDKLFFFSQNEKGPAVPPVILPRQQQQARQVPQCDLIKLLECLLIVAKLEWTGRLDLNRSESLPGYDHEH